MIVLAAHTGAGFIAQRNRDRHVKLLKTALKEGVRVYLANGCLQEAISQIVSVLENDSVTNAGHGGNLTETGKRENEAGLSFTKRIGGVEERGHGAVSGLNNVLNPIQVAKKIAELQSRGKDKQGRIPPILISGPGAEQFAKNNNISYREDLPIAEKALKVFKKYSKVLKRAAEKTNGPPEKIQKSCDTVGAVAMKIEKNDNNEEYSSDSVAASSSGGFVVKRNGRVGSAAHLGAGFWSQEDSCTTCSGCGEELIIHNTARLACSEEFLFDSHSIASNFPSSSNTGIELGFLKLLNDGRGGIELQYLHTTSDFMIGYVFLNPNLSDPDTLAYNCHHSENPKVGNSQYSSFRFSYSQD
ncbi:Oidioi.mRNA.OKI2018_I69.PAR.g11443.t2.cds [Oikopleura dioica]|uniref:Oidioi.mRNA.OKI2018_I69.PAR.g11443.t2.cds n=1 Tax=Oikopleura dioica TaxID=34765 RepID=A0ABN7RZS5_OIKDI|nr:Oidioi.mRNA.OKI2018_I69.PAR.g11443.t2.cds [Oikopleura dioica]